MKYHIKSPTMLGILVAMALNACSITTKPSAEALTALDHPPPVLQAKLARLLPAAVAWYWQTEQQYAPQGRLLTAKEQAIATKLGIVHPKQVRVVIAKNFPLPQDPELRKNAQSYGMGSPFVAGFTVPLNLYKLNQGQVCG